MSRGLLILGVFLQFASPMAWAIVNVENMRIGPVAQGFSSRFSLQGRGQSGNTDKLSLDLGGRMQWQQTSLYRFLVADFSYGESREVKDTSKAFIHGRWVKTYRTHRAWEAFLQGSRDEFARLRFRGVAGGGLRFSFPDPDKRELHLGLGGFYEHETIKDSGDLQNENDQTFRVNTYVVYKEQLNRQTALNFLQYYQPNVAAIDDFRLLSQAALVVKAAEKISIKLALDLTHDNKPPQGVRKTDLTYSTAIVVDF